MKKLSFWKADWFLGLIVVVVMLAAARGDLIQSLERKAYNLGVQAASRAPSDRIAVIPLMTRALPISGAGRGRAMSTPK